MKIASLLPRRGHCTRSFSSLVQWEVKKTVSSRTVGTITLNAPETRNALSVPMGQAFERLVFQITRSNDPLDAVILRGAASQAFSAGGDLSWLQSLSDVPVHVNADAMLHFYRSFLCIRQLPVPVICALTGPAVGAGAGLALACDFRIAQDSPKLLGFNFTKLGIHTGMGASYFVSQQLNPTQRNEVLYLGQMLSSKRAVELGLVNRLSDDAVAAAAAFADDLLEHTHPLAVRSLVRTLRTTDDAQLELALRNEAMAQAMCYHREDWGRGLRGPAVFDTYSVK